MYSFLKLILVCCLLVQGVNAQEEDCLLYPDTEFRQQNVLVAETPREHPKQFKFITAVPGNIATLSSLPFKKQNLKTVGVLAGGTALCLLFDQPIIDGAEKIFQFLGVNQQEKFESFLSVGKLRVIEKPGNINSFFYQLGQPGPTLLLAGGYYLSGKLKKDPRAGRTASELMESYLGSQMLVQSLKRICGRQSPNKATSPGGRWHWFPSWKEYTNDVTSYFAFPSGHMATMVSAVTVISLNYPEKRWIRPVGYSLTALTALSQLNNKTHWASDFFLGAAIGYASAQISHFISGKRR